MLEIKSKLDTIKSGKAFRFDKKLSKLVKDLSLFSLIDSNLEFFNWNYRVGIFEFEISNWNFSIRKTKLNFSPQYSEFLPDVGDFSIKSGI